MLSLSLHSVSYDNQSGNKMSMSTSKTEDLSLLICLISNAVFGAIN